MGNPLSWAWNTAQQIAGQDRPGYQNSPVMRGTKKAARTGYQFTGLPDLNRFAQDPTVANGFLAALSAPAGGMVALPFKGNKAKLLNKLVDSSQIGMEKMIPGKDGAAIYSQLFNRIPEFKGQLKPGGVYYIPDPYHPGQQMTLAQMKNTDRFPVVQDVETGALLIGKGMGMHHGDLMTVYRKMGGDPGRGFLQHELWGSQKRLDFPGKVNWDTYGITPDSKAATVARMKFVRQLQDLGLTFVDQNGQALKDKINKWNKEDAPIKAVLRPPEPAGRPRPKKPGLLNADTLGALIDRKAGKQLTHAEREVLKGRLASRYPKFGFEDGKKRPPR